MLKDKILPLLAAALEAEPAIAPHVQSLLNDFSKAQTVSTLMDEAEEAVKIVQAAIPPIGKQSRNTYGLVPPAAPAPAVPAGDPPAPASAPASPAAPDASPLTPAPAAT